MKLKFIGLLLSTVLTALCGFGFGGEVPAGGQGRCVPVNVESLRFAETPVDTLDRESGATVFGLMNPALTGMENLLPGSWKKSGFSSGYAEILPCGELGVPGTEGTRFRPDFRSRPRHGLYSKLPAGRAPPASFC